MFDFAVEMIREAIPSAVVHAKTDYEGYIELLNQCDMHFSPFPFGLTNGVVDSALCGLPMVALDGPEVHSHIDIGLQKRLGLPDWLSATTFNEYENAAIRLIEDDDLRVSVSNTLLEADPAKILFVDENHQSDYFAEVVHWIYSNHQRVQSEDKKVWRADEFLLNSGY